MWDSVILLYNNEFILIRDKYSWRLVKEYLQEVSGRRFYVPNPFFPMRVIFRGIWVVEITPVVEEQGASVDHFYQALRSFNSYVTALWCMLFVVLPIVLFILHADSIYLLIFMLVIYSLVALLGGRIHRFRGALELSDKDVFSLCLEALLCPPFAVNLIRKIALRRGIKGDVVCYMSRCMDVNEFAALIAQIGERIDMVLAIKDEDDPEAKQLIAYRDSLREMSK